MPKRKNSKKPKFPANETYDKKRPPTTFRTDEPLDQALKLVKTQTGMSNADVLRVGVGILKVKVKTESELREQIEDEVRRKVWQEAIEYFGVSYPCVGCGKEMVVDSEEEKLAIRKFLQDSEWGHSKCVNPEW